MRGQKGSGKNQWLRGIDGSRLNTAVEEQGDGGEGRSKFSGVTVTKSHDFRDPQQIPGNQGDCFKNATIVRDNDREESQDRGIIFSNQKRPRKEGSNDGKIELGLLNASRNGLDTDMTDDMDQNQKNLSRARAATQTCQSS